MPQTSEGNGKRQRQGQTPSQTVQRETETQTREILTEINADRQRGGAEAE